MYADLIYQFESWVTFQMSFASSQMSADLIYGSRFMGQSQMLIVSRSMLSVKFNVTSLDLWVKVRLYQVKCQQILYMYLDS